MGRKKNPRIDTQDLSKTYKIFDVGKKEKNFLGLILAFILISFLAYPYPHIAMWVGFMLAGYSAIANDSIQTIGTFIASNSHRKWYYLWLFMGTIFLVTVTISWIKYDGDVSYQRLISKGFETTPSEFSFLQLSAPIILLILTRMRMPVSTTFLLLNVFTTKASTILGIVEKSLTGYLLAFGLAIVVWLLLSSVLKKMLKKKPAAYWVYLQWVTSGLLWSVWIMQDAANIAIFLPRQLNVTQFIAFSSFIFLGLGLLFYMKGDRIQKIVDEKSDVRDVRSATIIDFVYCLLLYYKLYESTLPMSTTWLFIGLLGGREVAINITKESKSKRRKGIVTALLMIGKDLLYALIGLIVSMILALAINEEIRREVFDTIGSWF